MNKKTAILYVEDELAMAQIVIDTLEGQGYDVTHIDNGELVVGELLNFRFELCLLDVMLPSIDGFTLGRQIKKISPSTPIIYLTAKSETADVLEGFKSGGNDYLKKPFSLEELLVRIKNLLNLKGVDLHNTCNEIMIGTYRFIPNKLQLILNDSTRTLSHKENELIKYLAKSINQVINKKEILIDIWGDDSFYNTRNLDVYIKKIREYFSNDINIKIITLRGIGYRFIVE